MKDKEKTVRTSQIDDAIQEEKKKATFPRP